MEEGVLVDYINFINLKSHASIAEAGATSGANSSELITSNIVGLVLAS
jgi:hypothetical protein